MSTPQPRGPRRPTVVKRFADLPRVETPSEEKDRRIKEKQERRAQNQQAHEQIVRAKKEKSLPRTRDRIAPVTITWLPEKVYPVPGWSVPVVGVVSDCDPAVARVYL